MQRNSIIKKSISVFLLVCIFISSITPIKVNAADKTVTELKYQGAINKKLKHRNPIWVNYPNSEYGNYPTTIQYEKDGFKGTLQAKRIKLVPKNKKKQWVKNRKITRTGSKTGYFENKKKIKNFAETLNNEFPQKLSGEYYDSKSGKTISYFIPKSGKVYATGKNRTKE